MKIVDRLEDTLEGKYLGLYAEVVTCDCYRVKELKFTPTVVIDMGANVGCFTRFARELFPDALIVSVEPDMNNFRHLINFTKAIKNEFYRAAIGEGNILKRIDDNSMINGAHASYIPEHLTNNKYPLIKAFIETLMLDEIFKRHVNPTDKVLVKIDIEGAEFAIFEHEESVKCLERSDYFAFELHHEMEYYSEQEKIEKRKVVADFIKRLSKTHDIIHETVNLFGTKK